MYEGVSDSEAFPLYDLERSKSYSDCLMLGPFSALGYASLGNRRDETNRIWQGFSRCRADGLARAVCFWVRSWVWDISGWLAIGQKEAVIVKGP